MTLHDPPVRPDRGWHEDDWDDPDLVPVYDIERPIRTRVWLRRLLAVLALLVVAGLLAAGAVGLWTIQQVNPPGDPGDAVTFTVSEDDDLQTITDRLKEQGIITHPGVFEWYVKRKGGLEVVPGYYTIRPMDTMGNIVSVLRTPPAQTYTKVTFPEGFTVNQIGRRLSQTVTRLNEQTFITAATDGSITSAYGLPGQPSLEGLLFPDTYQVAGNETEADVVQRLVDLMERVGRQEGVDQAKTRLLREPYEVLIIASMIEREAAVDEDRAKIARVIYNRLSRGMPLQIDATLYYLPVPEPAADADRQRRAGLDPGGDEPGAEPAADRPDLRRRAGRRTVRVPVLRARRRERRPRVRGHARPARGERRCLAGRRHPAVSTATGPGAQ
jgi:UPF0755 protein